MRRSLLMLITLITLSIAAQAQGLGLGSAVELFSLPDLNGRAQALEQVRGRNGTVVVFLSVGCSVVKAYKDRINQMAADGQKRGISFVGVNSNAAESTAVIAANALEFGYRFPVLIDKDGRVADRFGARTAPEVFYLNAENVLLYRGAIDNDRSGTVISENYLLAAFDASLAGKPILKKSIAVTGCTIQRGGM